MTLLRLLLLVPVCWFVWHGVQGSWLPVVLLAIWASTDWVDGLLARLLDQRSKLGEWLDPFTDRLGIWGLALTLSISGVIGWWVLGVIFVVDMIVAFSAAKAARSTSRAGRSRARAKAFTAATAPQTDLFGGEPVASKAGDTLAYDTVLDWASFDTWLARIEQAFPQVPVD